MEQEEPREAELADQGQLLVEAGAGEALVAVRVPVAVGEGPVADARELDVRGLGAVGEVRVAVAELLGEVEAEPVGQLDRARDGACVVGEALEHRRRGPEDALAVAAPLGLACLERAAVADRDEHVLQQRPPRVVGVRIAGDDRLDPERLREVAERRVTARVAALERALELDEEPSAERAGKAGGRVRVAHGEPVAGAAGEADEALVQLLEQRLVERGLAGFVLPPGRPCVRPGGREQPAEVRVALRRLDEQRDVRAAGERDLGAGDRPHAERLGGVRELERAVDTVVIGERERLVAELGGGRSELLGLRGPVQERVRRVGMELDVAHAFCAYQAPVSPSWKTTATRPVSSTRSK